MHTGVCSVEASAWGKAAGVEVVCMLFREHPRRTYILTLYNVRCMYVVCGLQCTVVINSAWQRLDLQRTK